MSSVCDTRCLGGKFNYFLLLNAQFYSATLCKEEPFWEGFFLTLSPLCLVPSHSVNHLKSASVFFSSSPDSALASGTSSIMDLKSHLPVGVLIGKSPETHCCPHPSPQLISLPALLLNPLIHRAGSVNNTNIKRHWSLSS